RGRGIREGRSPRGGGGGEGKGASPSSDDLEDPGPVDGPEVPVDQSLRGIAGVERASKEIADAGPLAESPERLGAGDERLRSVPGARQGEVDLRPGLLALPLLRERTGEARVGDRILRPETDERREAPGRGRATPGARQAVFSEKGEAARVERALRGNPPEA